MKKILLIGLLLTSGFSLSLEDRVKILEEKVSVLEKKLNIVNKSQIKIKQDIQNNTILKCNKLKLLAYDYEYEDGGFVRSYNFNYKLKNDYNKSIKYIYASVKFIDDEDTTLVEDYIKKTILIKPHQEVNIKTNYLIDDNSLSEYLKDTPKKNLKIEFNPFTIEFSDGQKLRCN